MMKIIFGFCLMFFLVHGNPLESEEGETAFDNINDANSQLPGPFQNALNEGDMFLPQHGALDKKFGQWPNGYVPYTIHSDFVVSERDRIRSALDDIMEAAPCLNFEEFQTGSAPNDHVSVIKSGGCWSRVGKTGGQQSLSLGNGCVFTGTIIHEFLHAIGFYHEQSRPDRDQYVDVFTANIAEGREHNFRIARNINSLGVAYDLKSVMHYSNRAFSNGNGPTLASKENPELTLGGRVLTEKDKLQINLKYCGETTTTTTTTTTKRPTTTTTTTTTTPTTTTTTPTTTSIPTTTETTKPVTGACGDKSGYCIVAKRYASCSRSLKELCPRTCRACTGPKSEECLNLRDRRSDCQRRAERGDCRLRNNYQRWIMKNRCPRSCCERNMLY